MLQQILLVVVVNIVVVIVVFDAIRLGSLFPRSLPHNSGEFVTGVRLK